MKPQLFSPKYHYFLKSQVKAHYKDLLKAAKAEVSPEWLGNIFEDKSLNTYSPLKFYWSSLLEDYFYLQNLSDPEEIFTYWEKSDFCKNFISLLKKGKSISKASEILVKNLETQIEAFYVLHFGRKKESISYFQVREIGDFSKRIYLGERHFYLDLKKKVKAPLEIKKGSSLVIKGMGRVAPKKGNFFVYGKKLALIPNCEEGIERFGEFKEKIGRALKIIKKYSPDSFNTFLSFTHTIIPVNEPGIVSYSLQNLPGYSLINLFERDFIDLIDDLIHENGHHFLNTYLNFCELLNEDEDKIYYSPWRNSLRPIRGIYHACFTFFWALHLFGNLFRSLDKTETFSKSEKEKITSRFIEEYYMLNYCLPDLKHAYKNKKINRDGMRLINEIYSQIKLFKKDVSKALKVSGEKEKLLALKNNLNEKRLKYTLG